MNAITPRDKEHLPSQTGPAAEATAMLQMIKEVALTPGVNVDAIRAMLDMQRQLTRDQAERAFNEAMAKMSPHLPRIKRNGKVEYLDKNDKSGPKEEAFRFVKYEDIDRAIRPILAEYGFSLSFTTEPRSADGGGLVQVGFLKHIEGHFTEARFACALDSSGGKNNIQAMKSSSSYGKRAVVEMLLNIVSEGDDDDGKSAVPALNITNDQAVDIDLRARALGDTYHAKFLKWAKVSSVADIAAVNYKKVISALEEKEKTRPAQKATK